MLYIVPTPLGNLEDITLRQMKTLFNSDIILSEDTRSTNFLLDKIRPTYLALYPSHSTINKPKVISFYKEVEMDRLPEILTFLSNDQTVSLVSEAGMPLISDPGHLLVTACIKKSIAFEVIPGPTAYATALIYSGFRFDQCMFLGYFPKKSGELKSILLKIQNIQKNLKNTIFVAYETSKRISKTLQIIGEVLPDNSITIAREMTKKFEEIARGKAIDLDNRKYIGEITLVIGNIS